jgi:hypothetical protein
MGACANRTHFQAVTKNHGDDSTLKYSKPETSEAPAESRDRQGIARSLGPEPEHTVAGAFASIPLFIWMQHIGSRLAEKPSRFGGNSLFFPTKAQPYLNGERFRVKVSSAESKTQQRSHRLILEAPMFSLVILYITITPRHVCTLRDRICDAVKS